MLQLRGILTSFAEISWLHWKREAVSAAQKYETQENCYRCKSGVLGTFFSIVTVNFKDTKRHEFIKFLETRIDAKPMKR